MAMVFGNLGDDCATGVAFTRNPKNGATGLFGEYLVNAQGEDVVAGVRTPQPIRLAERIDDGPALDGGGAAHRLRRARRRRPAPRGPLP